MPARSRGEQSKYSRGIPAALKIRAHISLEATSSLSCPLGGGRRPLPQLGHEIYQCFSTFPCAYYISFYLTGVVISHVLILHMGNSNTPVLCSTSLLEHEARNFYFRRGKVILRIVAIRPAMQEVFPSHSRRHCEAFN